MANPDREVEFGTLAEQEDEAYYDDREDADDDMEKGRIKFPTDKLYGRDQELEVLNGIYQSFKDYTAESRVVFLGGYSGTGKSALVDEFCKQTAKKKGGKDPVFLAGKYGQMKAGEPFSAISQAFNSFIQRITAKCTKEELKPIKKRLRRAGIFRGAEDTKVLVSTFIPALDDLLLKVANSQETDPIEEKAAKNGNAGGSSVIFDMNVIKYAFQNFVKALATEREPLILFIDDLQWADNASIQLLTALLKDKSLKYVLFIGAYRSNEVSEDHDFAKTMKVVEESMGPKCTHKMEITNLSPESVGEFIADCIDMSVQEVNPITDAVYSKTLGNVFFVKQALEELVRKNAIYYDVMMFVWQFGDVSRVELEECLSDDVTQMVQSKMLTMPDHLRKAMSIAAYTKNTFKTDLLAALLKDQSINLSSVSLEKLMKLAFKEGLILYDTSVVSNAKQPKSFKFAHDRIREACCLSVPDGEERDQLLLSIARVLKDRGSDGEDDWMLFTAARHLNSIPESLSDPVETTELNLKVGKIAIVKGSFSDAADFFRSGVSRLDKNNCWKAKQYNLALDLYNNLLECEHTLGHEKNAYEAVDVVFAKAKSLPEKMRAQYVYVEAKCEGSSQNYSQSVDAGIEILNLYGVSIPLEPNDKQVRREKLQLKLALRGRSLLCLSKFPIAKDQDAIAQMKIAQITLRHAQFGKRTMVAQMLGTRMLRVALKKKCITKDLPFIVLSLGAPLREKEKYESASLYANAGMSLMDRFPEERGAEFLKAKIALFGQLICLRMSFRDAIEAFLELNRSLLAIGATDQAMAAAMLSMFSFLNASLPLGTLLEPKLILFQESAKDLGKKMFVVIMGFIRQALYNLQGGANASKNPTDLIGPAFNEDEVMAKFEGPAKKMNNRDIATMRLMLAVIFDDDEAMEKMLDRLDPYPVHDIPIARQHIRMSYVGFASMILAKKTDKYKKWAEKSINFFEKLSRFGSPNAQPVYVCLKALQKPSVEAFDEAIGLCENFGLLNLGALMNERCGLMLYERNSGGKEHEDYLKSSVWFYHDWGATNKVVHLQKKFAFLHGAIQEKPPSQLSSVRRQTAMLGVPRPSPLSASSWGAGQ